MIELFLVRHAIAVEPAEGMPDAARPLTPEGRRRVAQVVRGLARLGVDLDLIRHSPWTRAVETVDALARLRGRGGETAVDPLLARPPDQALLTSLQEDAAAAAERTGRPARVALVGHQPWMGQLAGWLVFGSKARGARIGWRKAGVAWLSGEARPGGMTLEALLPPRATRRMR